MRRWDVATELEVLVPEGIVDDHDDVAPPGVSPIPAPPAVRPDISGTFFRMVDLPGAVLAARIGALWDGDACIDVGACRLSRPSEQGAGVRVRGRWRRPMHRTGLPIEIELWPHLDRWTIITLAPRRRVRLSRHYYRAGHRLLDELTLALA